MGYDVQKEIVSIAKQRVKTNSVDFTVASSKRG